jgi:predicted lipoprotein with Yx(FWY)xxD motif
MADHVPLGQSFDPPPAKGTWDPFHINSIELGPGGDLLVSARETWSIYDIRHDAGGAVNWILDSKPAATDSTFSFGTGADFSWQHDARFRPNGEISLFDDHCCDLSVKSTTPPPTARGLVLKLDNTARTATMVHSYSRSPGLVVATQGNMQNLSNGNEFIGWGQAPVISEYSAAGRLVYEAQLPAADESYRTYRLPWSGLPSSKPAVKLIRHGARSTIYVSWNGATQVARWAVLAGATKGKLTLVKRVAKTGFETTIHVKLGQRRYLQIQALGATVQALASSAIKRVPAAPSRSNSTLQAHRASATVLGTEKVSNFGPVLAAASGHVLYEFDVDTRNRSHCTGRCTNTWQPFLASGSVTVKSGSGLKPKLVGRLKLPSGRYQVSYNGHPLYLYAKDRRAGQLNGQAKYQFGGDWYVLGPKGRAIACTPGLVCGY